MRDLASGAKTRIKSDQIRHLSVPHYDKLAIKHLLDFASDYPNVMRALPVEREIYKLTRQYIINVIYTLVGESFSQWVDARVEERNN